MSTASIVKDTRKLIPRLAPLMFKLLAGLHESHKEIRQQLASIPGRLSASLKSTVHGGTRVRTSQLLGVGLDVTGFRRIYTSMTVENSARSCTAWLAARRSQRGTQTGSYPT